MRRHEGKRPGSQHGSTSNARSRKPGNEASAVQIMESRPGGNRYLAHQKQTSRRPTAFTPQLKEPRTQGLAGGLAAAPPPLLVEGERGKGSAAGRRSPVVDPVQRLATDSLTQPDANRSDVVPDLSADLVTQIQNANSKAERTAVLQALLKYLAGKGIVDDLKLTKVMYKHANNANYAVTKTLDMSDAGEIGITVYKNCFTQGPAVLYSTLRHELIHVGQRLKVPDEDNAEFDDDYMHENIYDKEVGVKTIKTLQLPLQEIETHCWELVHAGETGVGDAYKADTVRDLVDYTDTLIKTVAKININTFIYWHDYLSKAVGLLVDAHGAYDDDAQSLEKSADALSTVVFQRADEAMA